MILMAIMVKLGLVRFAACVMSMVLTFLIAAPMAINTGQAAVPVPANQSSALTEASSVRIAFLGDTGSGVSFQQAVTDQLMVYHQKTPVSGVLHMGDVIYPAGDVEHHGDTLYTNYYKPLWDAGAKFYPVLGNHDVVNGFRPALLKTYHMPARYYKTQFLSNDGSVTVDAFAIDTNIANNKKQLTWLVDNLKTSKADWQVVYGHHPVRSSGYHRDSKTMISTYLPIFKQYGVDAYIAGHDHDYERFKPDDGVLLLVTGGGGAYLRSFPRVAQGSHVRLSIHHFVGAAFTKQQMTGEVIDKHGKVVDRFTHQPNG